MEKRYSRDEFRLYTNGKSLALLNGLVLTRLEKNRTDNRLMILVIYEAHGDPS